MLSRRHQRVRELLKRVIGEVLRREFSVDEVGVITVNDVGVSGDLQSAAVFVSILGSENQQKKGLHRLHQQQKRLQSLVGHEVILKYTPQLRFVVDDSIIRGNRVLKLLEELEPSLPPDEVPPQDP